MPAGAITPPNETRRQAATADFTSFLPKAYSGPPQHIPSNRFKCSAMQLLQHGMEKKHQQEGLPAEYATFCRKRLSCPDFFPTTGLSPCSLDNPEISRVENKAKVFRSSGPSILAPRRHMYQLHKPEAQGWVRPPLVGFVLSRPWTVLRAAD